jgi:hypothetical protein
VGAAEIQRIQAGTNNRVANLLHRMTEQLMLPTEMIRND